ncbi:MAG: phenylacetate-CoA oxygenase/reductase subunit PaaK [Burkholderiaceae bacterium]|jgi:ring-1,2-phenylacetyl-CoA epoxidase subunit PaaE|nr:phenylacetate-CoA oxygenase/reductase subunit PaaK [Burkholderiaceae bacterium]
MTPRFHTLTIAEVRRETAEAVSLAFSLPAQLREDFRFVPGQHLSLRTRLDGEEVRRSYSICAGLDDGELRVAIKKVAGGRFSAWATEQLKPGDAIDVMTPDGRFTVPVDAAHAKHYVAFAAGSGITPILSLARTLLTREPQSRFTLVYGNRRAASSMFQEALEDLKDRHLARFALFNVFSREEQEVELFNGRLDGAKVRAFLSALIPAASIDEAFVCGPGAMLDEVESALLQAGVAREHVHVERFGTPGEASVVVAAPEADAALARVTFIVDGLKREVQFQREHGSLLEAGAAAGLDLPFSCKGGMCCTCRAKLLAGEVKMRKNFALEAADLDAGFVLTCQSYPLSERVLLSFDDR